MEDKAMWRQLIAVETVGSQQLPVLSLFSVRGRGAKGSVGL